MNAELMMLRKPVKRIPHFSAALGLILSGSLALGGSATWLANPGSGDWNMASNWTPGGPPNSPADTATFQFSAVSDLSLSASTEVSAVTFDAGGSTLYQIVAGPSLMLSVSGAGLTNNSTFTQAFMTTVDSNGNVGVIDFANNAAAGVQTSFTNNGSLVDGRFGGATQFRNDSSASHGAFRNEGGLSPLAWGGITLFFDRSTAGNGVFVNHGGALLTEGLGSGLGGATLFRNDSTAGHGTFISMGDALGGAGGGNTAFFDTSTAADGTFVANGAAPAGQFGGAAGGSTDFHGSSTAANGTFFSNSAAVAQTRGGFTNFWDSSSAGHGTFFVDGGAFATPSFGVMFGAGHMFFSDDSTADHGVFFLDGGSAPSAPGGQIDFFSDATAGHGTFTINGGASGAYGGFVNFFANSTAANGTFTNHGGSADGARGGFIKFWDSSTSGEATFVNNGGGVRQFVDATTATNGGVIEFNKVGNGMITNNGGTVSGAGGGIITANDVANATIITNGGAVSDARGGLTQLGNTEDGTLIAHGGFGGGAGGSIQFFPDSYSTARVAVFGNGDLIIDSFDHARSVTIGSIEGDGSVFLGANNLTVGSNHLSTLFSGVLKDGGRISGQTGGSLTKIGPGTLALSDTSTYTGATTINEGELRIDGSITSAVTVNNGGTLGGSGRTGSVTVTSGGTVAPGDPPGALTINGNYSQNSGGVLKIEIAGTEPIAYDHLDITGSATLDGTLEVRFRNGFLPAGGQVFKLLNVAGAFAGSFAQITFPNLEPGFQFQADFVNGSYRITALNDGVAANALLNISTRMQVGAGDNALIGGFIVTGNAAKKVIIRGIGPSLEAGGTPLPGRLADPAIELRDNAGELIFSNDNWVDSPQEQQIIDSGIPPGDDHEAAIVATLAPGSYTAIMRGINDTTGIGLVEVYDLARDVSASLANLSTRGFVETGDNVMIGGFRVDQQASQVIVRAIGPSLTQFGIPNVLADPTLTLHNGDGAVIAFNDDWPETNQAAIEATGIPPSDEKESAIFATLAPGYYTAIVRGQNDTSGVGLVEVYNLQ